MVTKAKARKTAPTRASKRVKVTAEAKGNGARRVSLDNNKQAKAEEKQLEKIIKDISKAKSLSWEFTGCIESSGDGEERAALSLTSTWKDFPGEEELMTEVLKFADPNDKAKYAWTKYAMPDEDEFELQEAKDEVKAALEESGEVEDVPDLLIGEFSVVGEWSMRAQCNPKTLTNDQAKTELKELFNGKRCTTPHNYDSFGKTPLTPSDHHDMEEFEELKPSLLQIKDYVMKLADCSSTVEHAWWEGVSQSEGCDCNVERTDYFLFKTASEKEFLLTFEWSQRSLPFLH